MAVTQYIGARYVPMFYTASDNTNTWESGVAYDPLTIVTYLNQSYTSKIPVPASTGNPAENPDYWVLTGAYSAQVEQYRQEVVALSEDVEELAESIENTGDYVLIITDSYGVSSSGYTAFTDILTYYNYTKIVKAFDYVAAAGAGFASVTGQSSFTDLLQNYSGSLSDTDVTRIIVVGGTNDAKLGFTTTVSTGINSFVTAATTRFTNLKQIDILYCAHVDASNYSYPDIDATYQAYMNYRNTFPVFVYNAINIFGLRNLQSDMMHPNQDGQYQLARAVIEFTATGAIPIDDTKVVVTGSLPSGFGITIHPGREYSYIEFSIIATGVTALSFAGSSLSLTETVIIGDATFLDTGNSNTLRQTWGRYNGGSSHALVFVAPLPSASNSTYTIYFNRRVPVKTSTIALNTSY